MTEQPKTLGAKKFFLSILVFLIATDLAILLNIPFLRQILGFLFLTILPGLLILRILKLNNLNTIETILYTVGLSIAFLMFTGLFMNTLYPLIGISKPISTLALIITMNISIIVLCILGYKINKGFLSSISINIKDILSPPVLFLCLIPFLSILGTYLVNFHHNNIILMFLILILAMVVLLITFDKVIPKNLYPLALFIIAISLLCHNSLISMYLWGYDIHYEYYLSNLVMGNSYWDSTIPSTCNAMLSLVMLAPIFSDICSVSLTWVFKTIYPLLFSLVPLGLYRVFQKQTEDKIAFLSCFFLVSIFTFYTEMLGLARQQIAELFLVLLILLMVNKDMNKIKRSFLFIVFGFSLAVSHYGLSYIYMFCLISAWLILVLMDSPAVQRSTDIFFTKFSRYKSEKLAGNPNSFKIEGRTISSTFVLIFIIFTLTWYMYVSSSSAFNAIIHIGDHIASSLFTDFLNPKAAQGLDAILKETASPMGSVLRSLHLITQFFIVVGVLTSLLKHSGMRCEKEYAAFSYVNLMICFACIAVPHFSSSLETTRLYHITLIFLAPFCVIGGITVFKVISRVVRASWTNKSVKNSLKVLSVFFAIFLLFNSGFVFEIAKDRPHSISLSEIENYPLFNDEEVYGANWLISVISVIPNSPVYADTYGRFLLNEFYIGHSVFWGVTKKIPDNAYIYLRSFNAKEMKIVHSLKERGNYINLQNSTFFNDVLIHRNKIYTNGGSEIYR